MTKKTLTTSDLRQFTGSETWYMHWCNPRITFTDGVKYVAQHGGAFWLIDAIVFRQDVPAVKATRSQFWKLAVANKSAILSCEDGNGDVVYTQVIDFTDFPLPEIKIWFMDNVLLLP